MSSDWPVDAPPRPSYPILSYPILSYPRLVQPERACPSSLTDPPGRGRHAWLHGELDQCDSCLQAGADECLSRRSLRGALLTPNPRQLLA